MTGQDQDRGQDRDPWEEFDRLKPAGPDRVAGQPGGEPHGFGFRTGVRSARVAYGFAVYTLVLGTALAVTGAVVFIGTGQWLLLGLMGLVESVFILAFARLVTQARNRRAAG
ncbi:hypothetical protein [Arthrobacter oryzae]|uniref:Uncharacterized protein n=1 Tax=Arthrobacter oryzae TaxID=409290 RepID=A0A3N0BZH8_9MICC|nr:hypothetical protein [Arthrobacter oryzae]RNL55337.1 hypothetical protein D7003_10260 [Arthrobacter oryzae]